MLSIKKDYKIYKEISFMILKRQKKFLFKKRNKKFLSEIENFYINIINVKKEL